MTTALRAKCAQGWWALSAMAIFTARLENTDIAIVDLALVFVILATKASIVQAAPLNISTSGANATQKNSVPTIAVGQGIAITGRESVTAFHIVQA